MKVKFLTSVVGRGFAYHGGRVYSLPAEVAKYYIKLGEAEEVKEEKPKQRPLIVQQIKKSTTAKRPVKKTG